MNLQHFTPVAEEFMDRLRASHAAIPAPGVAFETSPFTADWCCHYRALDLMHRELKALCEQ
jgi:hypothetical protein